MVLLSAMGEYMNKTALLVVTDSERAKILFDPTRSAILSALQETSMTIQQLATSLDKTPPTILHHLRRLQKYEFVEIVKTRKVKNYVEKYYRSTIPKSTEVILAAPVISKAKTKELSKKPNFFRGKKFVIEEEAWKDVARQLLPRLGMTDLSEGKQRVLLTNFVELLELASLRVETILQGLLLELERTFPRDRGEIKRRLLKNSSTIAAYAIDNDEFFEKTKKIFQIKQK
jgi:DNA-binding transcriptional ArsR family regulator